MGGNDYVALDFLQPLRSVGVEVIFGVDFDVVSIGPIPKLIKLPFIFSVHDEVVILIVVVRSHRRCEKFIEDVFIVFSYEHFKLL